MYSCLTSLLEYQVQVKKNYFKCFSSIKKGIERPKFHNIFFVYKTQPLKSLYKQFLKLDTQLTDECEVVAKAIYDGKSQQFFFI